MSTVIIRLSHQSSYACRISYHTPVASVIIRPSHQLSYARRISYAIAVAVVIHLLYRQRFENACVCSRMAAPRVVLLFQGIPSVFCVDSCPVISRCFSAAFSL
ncbi:MAG: hypothetical protein K2N13_00815 [Paraprevotella sp.]|nr:hypothetical protein [Paraprevotella sp.]